MFRDLVEIIRDIKSGLLYRNIRRGFRTGTFNSDGTLNSDPTTGLDDGYIWVHPSGNRAAVSAINIKVNDTLANVPVIVGEYRSSRELVVIDVDFVDAQPMLGSLTATFNVPARVGEFVSEILPGDRFKPLRVRKSDLGGLYIYIEAGEHDGGYWNGGDFNLTSYLPATASTKAWIKVGIDTSTNLITAGTGSELPLVQSTTRADGKVDTIDLGSTVAPLAGLVLTDSDTTLDNNDIVDLRRHIDTSGAGIATHPLTIDAGETVTIPSGRGAVWVGTIDVDGTLELDGTLAIL